MKELVDVCVRHDQVVDWGRVRLAQGGVRDRRRGDAHVVRVQDMDELNVV